MKNKEWSHLTISTFIKFWKGCIIIRSTRYCWRNIILSRPRIFCSNVFWSVLFWISEFPVITSKVKQIISTWSRCLRIIKFWTITLTNFCTTRSSLRPLTYWIISARSRSNLNILLIFDAWNSNSTFNDSLHIIATWSRGKVLLSILSLSISYLNWSFLSIISLIISTWSRSIRI